MRLAKALASDMPAGRIVRCSIVDVFLLEGRSPHFLVRQDAAPPPAELEAAGTFPLPAARRFFMQ